MFSSKVLDIDASAASTAIAGRVKQLVLGKLKRRGVVVGLSGGIDSSVVAALAVRALGPNRVLGLFMPEKDSSDDSLKLGELVATTLGIEAIVENIGSSLKAIGCYERQAQAVRTMFPEYGDGYRCKISLPTHDDERLNVFQLTIESPSGERKTARMPVSAYLQLVAATNFKQRLRKTVEYYHADRVNYAVAGTPNRLEYDQGFFVKQGDGAADIKPIAHLYKTQVYTLARHLGIPEEICVRPPTTDTYSLPQTQEEFYFVLPYQKMDLCLYAVNHGVAASLVAPAVDLTPEQVERVFRDIHSKRRSTTYGHAHPLLIEDVSEVAS